MIRSSLRAVSYLAADVVAVAKWAVGEVLDELDCRLTPKHVQQGWDEFLAEEEADREVWEPGEASHLSWGVDGATTVDTSLAEGTSLARGLEQFARGEGVSSDWLFEQGPPADLSAASADDVPPSSVADDGPSEVCGVPPLPSEGHPLADLIAEALAGHMADADSRGVYCSPCNSKWDSWGAWRAHVAPLIAERIEKATPPADFTVSDMERAAAIVDDYANLPQIHPGYANELRELGEQAGCRNGRRPNRPLKDGGHPAQTR